MAFDVKKPADTQTIAAGPAEIRENLRALKDDKIVNAQKVMDLSPGNASGNLPVANGNLCVNLNAEKLGGSLASAFAAANHTHGAVTTSSNGLMSNTDKAKLDGIAAGAEVNQNAFANILVGSTTITADGKTDSLELVAGTNIALTPDATNDRVAIAVTGTVLNATAATNATNHIAASSGAHAASAISCTATGDVAATNVQAAIAELASEKVPASDVVTTATANKLLKLNSSGVLPASITGNAATATKLAQARTITLTGDVTGAVSTDMSGNVSISTTAGALATIPTSVTLNGSFETGEGVPTGWNVQYFVGGSGGFETENPAHGSRAWRFTHPGGAGNGGGWLESQLFEVSALRTKFSSIGFIPVFTTWSNVAEIRNIGKVRYYDKNKTFISEEVLYDSTSPTEPTLIYSWSISMPSTTRFYQLVLVGGDSSVDVPGTTWFDDVVINPVEAQGFLPCKTAIITSGVRNTDSKSYINMFASHFAIPNIILNNYPHDITIRLPITMWADGGGNSGRVRVKVGDVYSPVFEIIGTKGIENTFSLTIPSPVSFPLLFTVQTKANRGNVYINITKPALITFS
jgi:hypothetical protein